MSENTTTQDGNHKKNLLSTREWIMAIVIIVMAQLLLHFWASETMDSSQVINYFSFAGTITSIILAVLAIIYSYVQSISQQNTSETISREVHNLSEITSVVNDSADRVSKTTDELPALLDRLNALPNIIDDVISKHSKVWMESANQINDKADLIKSALDGQRHSISNSSGIEDVQAIISVAIAMKSVFFKKKVTLNDYISYDATIKFSHDDINQIRTIMANAAVFQINLFALDLLITRRLSENDFDVYHFNADTISKNGVKYIVDIVKLYCIGFDSSVNASKYSENVKKYLADRWGDSIDMDNIEESIRVNSVIPSEFM